MRSACSPRAAGHSWMTMDDLHLVSWDRRGGGQSSNQQERILSGIDLALLGPGRHLGRDGTGPPDHAE